MKILTKTRLGKATLLAVILTAGLGPMPVNAADLLSGAVGYAIGKSTNKKEKKIEKHEPIMGVLPIKCTLTGAGSCISDNGWSRTTPTGEMCAKLGDGYIAAGFVKAGAYASEVLILCKRP